MGKSKESVDHLFLVSCGVLFSIVLGLAWVLPKRVVDLFTCWRGLRGSPRSTFVWKMVLSCLLWCIWRERNDRSFEDNERMVPELKSFFFKALYHCTTTLDLNLVSFYDFLDLFSLSD
jgi:hypothetical protein